MKLFITIQIFLLLLLATVIWSQECVTNQLQTFFDLGHNLEGQLKKCNKNKSLKPLGSEALDQLASYNKLFDDLLSHFEDVTTTQCKGELCQYHNAIMLAEQISKMARSLKGVQKGIGTTPVEDLSKKKADCMKDVIDGIAKALVTNDSCFQ